MANEIAFVDPFGSGRTDYVTITNSVGQWWNTVAVAFQAFNGANWTDYDIAATEFGTSSTYAASMPSLSAGIYGFVARNRAGGSPAQSDQRLASGDIIWSGTAIVSANEIADAFLGRNIAGGSSSGRLVKEAFAAQRNKVAFDVPGAGQFTVFGTDDVTPLWTGTYTTAAGNPVTVLDPA